MATRSVIGVVLRGDDVKSLTSFPSFSDVDDGNDVCVMYMYCHFDGYPDNQLPLLTNSYNTYEKVLELVKLRGISSLRDTYASSKLCEYDRDDDGYNTFFCPEESALFSLLYHGKYGGIEYAYVFGVDDEWRYSGRGD